MKIIVFLLCPLLLLTGCATSQLVWNHRSGTNDQDRWNKDRYVCTQESRTQVSGVYFGRGAAMAQLFDQIAAEQQSNRLFAMCMEAHGWVGTLVRQ